MEVNKIKLQYSNWLIRLGLLIAVKKKTKQY